jgi:hypothetical protein
MTRGDLGKHPRVKARDIAIVEEQTPRAPAGLLEAALSLLLRKPAPKTRRNSDWPPLSAPCGTFVPP